MLWECLYEPKKAIEFVNGEVAEWLMAHAWNACFGDEPDEGSNPSLSVLPPLQSES